MGREGDFRGRWEVYKLQHFGGIGIGISTFLNHSADWQVGQLIVQFHLHCKFDGGRGMVISWDGVVLGGGSALGDEERVEGDTVIRDK